MARRVATRTSIVEPEDFDTGLRYEWLDRLKVEELRLLCEHRKLDGDKSSKAALIPSIIKFSSSVTNYDRWKKSTFLLELKARGVDVADDATLEDVTSLMDENRRTKPTKQTLSALSLSELQKLASRRKIKTGASRKEKSVKQDLVELLRKSQAPDPLYTQAMTTKQLSVELKGRGLSGHARKKEDMLKVLESDVTYEEQQLQQHIGEDALGDVIENAKTALVDYIQYMKTNAENIRKHVKHSSSKASKAGDHDDLKWDNMEDVVRDARDELIEVRAMIEAYSGTDLGKDETMPNYQIFDKMFACDNDSDVAPDDGVLFAVYEDKEDLIMKQDRQSILGVFYKQSEAEAFKKKYLKKHKNKEVEIQEIEMSK
eukprot:CAMPEP_0202698750 /NCGR_PEP_ID=MMETSP1385-20130828/11981_1 /ASSEMBLY_ACC=CAM_ASM_000861 /TAXON_ID=933848 /ORGANISM="Elphidium margaritaceum" /LENGTH=371 /DNA_ID=CAMNT_0049355523 /DNA_START=53 /DNA_END=1168 /DNA_ORIENTATION=-